MTMKRTCHLHKFKILSVVCLHYEKEKIAETACQVSEGQEYDVHLLEDNSRSGATYIRTLENVDDLLS